MDNAKMMADAYNLRKAIEAEVIEVEENGIKVTMGGDLKIKKIEVHNIEDDALKNVVNTAVRRIQEMMVLKMKEITNSGNMS